MGTKERIALIVNNNEQKKCCTTIMIKIIMWILAFTKPGSIFTNGNFLFFIFWFLFGSTNKL